MLGNCDTSPNIIPVVTVSLIPFVKVVVGSPATSPPPIVTGKLYKNR